MRALAAQAHVKVVDDARSVGAMLPPLRRLILAQLHRPDSAAGLARRLGLARQKVNYHLRQLERAGLLECVEERQRRGCVERCLRPTARAFVLSPAFLGELTADPEILRDRFSSAYLMAVASRTVRDVGLLRERARSVDRKLVTMSMEADVSFASPAELKSFADELSSEISRLIARYHRPASASRAYRFTLGAHPIVTKTARQAALEKRRHRDGTVREGGQP